MSEARLAAPAMMPTSASERIDVIDILRGLALFGILAANMRGFSAPSQAYFNVDALFKGYWDQFVQTWVYILIEGKFVTLFSFLFGLGFAAQMDRAEARGSGVSFYPRRLTFLLLFGLIHAIFIWWGDILVGYALTGFVLFLFRNAKQRTIAIWAIGLFLVNPIQNIASYVYHLFVPAIAHTASAGGGDAQLQRTIQEAIQVYRDGSFGAMVHQRLWDWFSFVSRMHLLIATYTLPRFLAGLWVWRSGLFRNLPERMPLVRKVWMWAFVLALLTDGISSGIFELADHGHKFPVLVNILADILFGFSVPPLSTFYACTVLVVCQSPVWKRRLAPFGAVGRMALTNYIAQSVICTYFFRWTGLYGVAGPAWDLLPTVALYGLQVPFSVWWLKEFRFGPLEWLWRSLTYGARQPMRRVSADPSALPAEA